MSDTSDTRAPVRPEQDGASWPAGRVRVLLALMFGATALSFLDRQVLSVLAPYLTIELRMSNADYSRVVFAFVLSYTVMFAFGGRLMDLLGTRLGLMLSVGLWSLASALHALATGTWSLAAARFLLGVGEGACFPAVTKGAVEWVPLAQRSLAVGVANGGSALGAVLAPPLTAWGAGLIGWRGVFVASALLGLLWMVGWHLAFRGLPPGRALDPGARTATTPGIAATPGLAGTPGLTGTPRHAGTPGHAATRTGFRDLLGRADVRRLMAARFLFDPVFYFYMFWIPQYLSQERDLSLARIGALTWIPFLALGISNIAAGHLSDRLVRRGWAPRRARLTLMLAAALLTPVSWLAATAGTVEMAIGLMALLLFAHGIWIANFITLVGDTVDACEVATTVGLTGTAGGVAGMLSNLAIGALVDAWSFLPVFFVSALLYPCAWLILAPGRPARKTIVSASGVSA